jgi:hypothetical protein
LDVAATPELTGVPALLVWGAVGIAPEGVRPVDMLAVNSLELPPFSACGGSDSSPYGCGRLSVNGNYVSAAATKWATHEAGRRSAPLADAGGVVVESATRMPFEQSGVMWSISFSNPSESNAVSIKVEFELSVTAAKFESVGTWVYQVPVPLTNSTAIIWLILPALAAQVPSDQAPVDYSAFAGQQKGVAVCGTGDPDTGKPATPACARYVFSGSAQPDTIAFAQTPSAHPPATPAGSAHPPTATFEAMKIPANGTVTVTLSLAVGGDAEAALAAQDGFARDAPTFRREWEAAHTKWQHRWAQAFTPPSSSSSSHPPRSSDGEAAVMNDFWSGSLPTLELDPAPGPAAPPPPPGTRGSGNTTTTAAADAEVAAAAAAADAEGVMRVYYVSCLTVISQARTNLPVVHSKVWPNGNGNLGASRDGKHFFGIGGSRSWWWDEALTSIMFALLEPAGRAPTFQAWLAHDDHAGTTFGHGLGNGYALDCPLGAQVPTPLILLLQFGLTYLPLPRRPPSAATPAARSRRPRRPRRKRRAPRSTASTVTTLVRCLAYTVISRRPTNLLLVYRPRRPRRKQGPSTWPCRTTCA